MTLVTTITGKLDFLYNVSTGGTSGKYQPIFDFGDTLSSGVGLDAGDLLYAAKAVALSGSGTNNLDIAGSVTDGFGQTLTMVKVKLFYFKNLSTTAGNSITLGNHATAPFLLFSSTGTHTHVVGPNGFVLIHEPSLAGKAVTATTGDILKILNNTANAVTYDIAIVGTSA